MNPIKKLRPILYDLQMRLASQRLSPIRRALVAGCQGTVLELGVGTGLNLPFYTNDASVWATDPDLAMLDRAKARGITASAEVLLVAAKAETLPFRDGQFDEVVASLVLCSVESPSATLAEIHRVLKPGGHFRFYEHVRSESPLWSRVQDWLTPACILAASG